MPATFRDRALWSAAVAAAAATAWTCTLQPSGPELSPGEAADVDCSACHALDELRAPVSALPPGEWAASAAEGVVLAPGRERWELPWPERGHHDPEDTETCGDCHPVFGRTSGHGRSRYAPASEELLFRPGASCAEGCHPWRQADDTTYGPLPAEGYQPTYSGSFRPADLLAADASAGGAHGLIWLGEIPEEPAAESGASSVIGPGSFEPGCGGCHARVSGEHGAVATCLHCHRFVVAGEGGQHDRHTARIDEERGRRAPGLADRSTCSFCHCRDVEPDGICRAACYTCHLSGHLPTPLLWREAEEPPQ